MNSTGVVYTMARVRRTGIRFPRLVRYRDQAVVRKINQQIDKVTSEFGCGGGSKESYYKVRARVEFAEQDIFSIYASAAFFCGAYPTNDANISMTFDLRTGKEINFGDLFANYEKNKREILRTVFGRQVARSEKLIKTGSPKTDTCEGDPELFSLDNLEASEFAFNFSKTGLKVQPQWPHVVEACAEIVTVPYSKLIKFAAPEGLLARLSK